MGGFETRPYGINLFIKGGSRTVPTVRYHDKGGFETRPYGSGVF